MKKSIIGLSIAAAMTQGVAIASDTKQNTDSSWKASLIADFLYFNHSEKAYPEIEGFPTGDHAHGPDDGLQISHIEALIEGDLNDFLKTRLTLGVTRSEEDGFEFEWEELYLQTKGIGNGLKFTLGRQFTEIGYHTSKHKHEWNFADQPLIIDAINGAHPTFDGARVNWLAPTDQYLELGAEVGNGDAFPAAGGNTYTLFAKTGGDFSASNSWLVGAGYYSAADVNKRKTKGHEHEGEAAEESQFKGEIDVFNVNAIYKWAPNGNFKSQNLTLQVEYFEKTEKGNWTLVEDNETLGYTGKHSGYYAQAVYQWQPNWRVGYRYETLTPDNKLNEEDGSAAADEEYEHAGLHGDHSPLKQSIMLDYSPRHQSLVRLQYNIDKRNENVTDNQWLLQYTHSFGSHGAHAY